MGGWNLFLVGQRPGRGDEGAADSGDDSLAGRGSRYCAPARGGFWYSLAPNADEKLKAYVYKYIKIMGEGPAKAMASMVDRSSHDAVRASLDAYEELGVEECWLNSATAEIAEIDGLLEVIEKRG